MAQLRIVVADKDAMFLEKFSAYLLNNKTTHFALELFTNTVMLDTFLENKEKVDLIVLSSTFFAEINSKPDSQYVLILEDSPGCHVSGGYYSLPKFQSAENLLKEVISLCAEKLPERLNRKSESGQLHLVLYADGSDVFNPIAYTIAGILYNPQKPTFYMSLDEIPDTDSWLKGTNAKSLSEMLYYIKSHKDNLALRAESCTSRDLETGINYMAGHKNPEDITSISADECERLIGAIRERNFYEHIIVSRAFRFDEILKGLMNAADKIYIAALDYPSSLDRISRISVQLPNFMKDSIQEKILCCITQSDKVNKSQIVDIPDYHQVYLPFPFEDHNIKLTKVEYQSVLKSVLERGNP